jgi:hypothetical protein
MPILWETSYPIWGGFFQPWPIWLIGFPFLKRKYSKNFENCNNLTFRQADESFEVLPYLSNEATVIPIESTNSGKELRFRRTKKRIMEKTNRLKMIRSNQRYPDFFRKKT